MMHADAAGTQVIARGRALLFVTMLAVVLPFVAHIPLFGVPGPASSYAWIRAAMWPFFVLLFFVSIWKGSHKNRKFFGWLLAVAAMFGAYISVVPAENLPRLYFLPSTIGWTIAALLLLASKDLVQFVENQSQKGNRG